MGRRKEDVQVLVVSAASHWLEISPYSIRVSWSHFIKLSLIWTELNTMRHQESFFGFQSVHTFMQVWEQIPIERTVLWQHYQEGETEEQLHRLILHNACLSFAAQNQSWTKRKNQKNHEWVLDLIVSFFRCKWRGKCCLCCWAWWGDWHTQPYPISPAGSTQGS